MHVSVFIVYLEINLLKKLTIHQPFRAVLCISTAPVFFGLFFAFQSRLHFSGLFFVIQMRPYFSGCSLSFNCVRIFRGCCLSFKCAPIFRGYPLSCKCASCRGAVMTRPCKSVPQALISTAPVRFASFSKAESL